MCGIVGIFYFDPERRVRAEDLRAMADAIVHRGPDDHGYLCRGSAGIGMRRLSIIDLEGGHQPIVLPGGRKAIVFNGEVYNFVEERTALEAAGRSFATRSDTEVVLQLYDEHGDRFVEHLNGMFGLAIWDEDDQGLVLVRDRLGVKPLYYYQDAERLVFASEIKAILACPGIARGLDREGLAAYLRYGFTPAPFTLYSGIRKLPPATLMHVDRGGVRTEEYWRPGYAEKWVDGEEVLAERLYELTESAVRYQMVSDVPLGAFLSGGLDSSGIVHLMREIGANSISTYSIGFGAEHAFHSELPSARRFAADYKTDHHEIVVEPDVAELFPKLVRSMDEPVADSSFIVTYLVSRLARETAKVILSGVGGDELFGGYRRYLNTRLNRYLAWIPHALRARVIAPLARKLPADRNSPLMNQFRLAKAFLGRADQSPLEQYSGFATIVDDDLFRELTGVDPALDDHFDRLYRQCDSDDPLDAIMFADLRMSLPEQLLMLTDKMTMAVSLEARVPYLDHRLVEFAARLPTSLKIKGLDLRYLQKRAIGARLPDYVTRQRKRGFGAPIGAWIRSDFGEMLNDYLGEETLRRQGLFNPEQVSKMLVAHREMREDHTDFLLALLAFQIWIEDF